MKMLWGCSGGTPVPVDKSEPMNNPRDQFGAVNGTENIVDYIPRSTSNYRLLSGFGGNLAIEGASGSDSVLSRFI